MSKLTVRIIPASSKTFPLRLSNQPLNSWWKVEPYINDPTFEFFSGERFACLIRKWTSPNEFVDWALYFTPKDNIFSIASHPADRIPVSEKLADSIILELSE